MPGDADELIERLAAQAAVTRDDLIELAQLVWSEGSDAGHYDMCPYGY